MSFSSDIYGFWDSQGWRLVVNEESYLEPTGLLQSFRRTGSSISRRCGSETAPLAPDEEPKGYIVITQPDPKSITDIDAGIASQVICSSTWEKGVGSCIMVNFDHEKVEEFIQMPNDSKAVIVIAVGYPAHEGTITDVGSDHSLKYLVDPDGNNHYYIPKLPVRELCRFL